MSVNSDENNSISSTSAILLSEAPENKQCKVVNLKIDLPLPLHPDAYALQLFKQQQIERTSNSKLSVMESSIKSEENELSVFSK